MYYLLKEWPVEIQTFGFQIKAPNFYCKLFNKTFFWKCWCIYNFVYIGNKDNYGNGDLNILVININLSTFIIYKIIQVQ